MSTSNPPSAGTSPPRIKRKWYSVNRVAAFAVTLPAAIIVLIAAFHFPCDTDAPLTEAEAAKNRRYYAEAYAEAFEKATAKEQGVSEYESKYVRVAEAAAKTCHIEEQVAEFVKRYNLGERPVLEIGSGRGYLQDLADDYTGLDISPNVRRFYHKNFVLGSATSLPFSDNTFVGAWSIWVLEHVPNPEQALTELRRVMRDKGVVFLYPAWNCANWRAEGYSVRPYSDFSVFGKINKASIPVRASLPFSAAAIIPNRCLRNLACLLDGPTRLHYRRLVPNYETYWEPDSDAVNSIDRYEVMLWFESRGDECLNCTGIQGSVLMPGAPLVVRIHK